MLTKVGLDNPANMNKIYFIMYTIYKDHSIRGGGGFQANRYTRISL
jgi:hypothetical protein